MREIPTRTVEVLGFELSSPKVFLFNEDLCTAGAAFPVYLAGTHPKCGSGRIFDTFDHRGHIAVHFVFGDAQNAAKANALMGELLKSATRLVAHTDMQSEAPKADLEDEHCTVTDIYEAPGGQLAFDFIDTWGSVAGKLRFGSRAAAETARVIALEVVGLASHILIGLDYLRMEAAEGFVGFDRGNGLEFSEESLRRMTEVVDSARWLPIERQKPELSLR